MLDIPLDPATLAVRRARLAASVAGYSQLAVSTEPCDRDQAEQAVRLAYRAAGFAEPAVVAWVDSPLGLVAAQSALLGVRRSSSPAGQAAGALWERIEAGFDRDLGDWIWPGSPEAAPAGLPLRSELVWGAREQALARVRAALDPDSWQWLERDAHTARFVAGQRAATGHRELAGKLVGRQLTTEAPETMTGLQELLGGQGDPIGVWTGYDIENLILPKTMTKLQGLIGDPDPIGAWTGYDIENLVGAQELLEIAETGRDQRLDALITTLQVTGQWWPTEHVAVICDRPTWLTTTPADPTGDTADAGPLAVWADGYQLLG